MLKVVSAVIALLASSSPSLSGDLEIHCEVTDIECRAFAGSISNIDYEPEKGGAKRIYDIRGRNIEMTDWEAERARRCLVFVAYREARGEDPNGILAVMNVVLNRVAANGFPNDICSVVSQRWAFEGVTRGSASKWRRHVQAGGMPAKLTSKNPNEQRLIYYMRVMAYLLVDGHDLGDVTNGATHYFAPVAQSKLNRSTPKWAEEFELTAVIGDHHFFKN
jgi:hypothetical protein